MDNQTFPLTPGQIEAIQEPISNDALTSVEFGKKLTSIKPVFITERLNKVFGYGQWQTQVELIPINGQTVHLGQDSKGNTVYTVMVKVIFTVPNYGIHYEQIASSNNTDMGDAAKGGASDALGKICSFMGIAEAVYKGEQVVFKKEKLLPSHALWASVKAEIKNGTMSREDVEEKFDINDAMWTVLNK